MKHELARILPELEEMRKRKSERRAQFKEVQEQILSISNEVYGSKEYISAKKVVDESDLSLRKLEELHGELQKLQKEKVNYDLVHLCMRFLSHMKGQTLLMLLTTQN